MKLKLRNKNIAIVYRLHTEKAVELASQLSDWLTSKKYKVFTAPEQKKIKGSTLLKNRSELSKMSLVIVLGGDGTYLRAVRLLAGANVPVLGFNMGSLGFLTAHRAEEVFKLTELTLKGRMTTHKRTVICARVNDQKKHSYTFAALNDIVLERGSNSQLISTVIQSDGHLISQLKADGLIISTPTGSTAYNLAAGGPILHPEVKALVVTPVSPHSLTSRPLIFPQDRILSFKIDNPDIKAHLVVDGQKVMELTHNEELNIELCTYDHLMITEESYNFFHLLREKLKFGDRN